jgi:transposase
MQADAYAGFDRLYKRDRKPGPIIEASCWAHARRKFFDLARINKAPIAIEAVERIDVLFAIEREINGKPADERKRMRQEHSRPLVEALEPWLRAQQRKLSASNEIAKAIRYSLNCWTALTRFLDDGRLCMSNNAAERGVRPVAVGRLCMSNNAAERGVRPVAVGRHNWTFVGSDEGGRRAAAIYTLVETCKLNDVDPQAWLADVLARLPDHSIRRIDELLPWNWKHLSEQRTAA